MNDASRAASPPPAARAPATPPLAAAARLEETVDAALAAPRPAAPTDDEAVELLRGLVATPSPSGQEALAVSLLVRRMREFGFSARADAVGNAVGTITGGDGAGGPHLVLLGHIDTVPGVIPVRREGDRLHGRGTVDAKGPLVAFVVAAARAAASGRLHGRVTVIGCVEEEAASSRGAHHAATLPAPDACIVGEPSRWDRMTLGYKGYLRARLSRAIDAGHGAHDRASASALACRLGVRLEQGAQAFDAERAAAGPAPAGTGATPGDRPLPAWDRLLVHVARVAGGSDGLDDRAELDVVLRLPPDLPPDAAERWLVAQAPDWDVTCEGGLPAWDGPRTTPLHRALARAIAAAGGRPRFVRKTGTADLNVVAPAWRCPALAYGPGDAALDHTPNEHIELPEFHRGIAVLEHLITQGEWAP